MSTAFAQEIASDTIDLDAVYVSGRRVLSAAVFYKEIAHPIYEVNRTNQSGDFGEIVLTNARVRTWENARKAEVSGLELNA